MSGSGLIYVAVLGAWAIYLLSRCVRTAGRDLAPAEGTVLRRRGAPSAPAAGEGYAMVRPSPADPAAPVVKRRQADAVVATRPVRVSAATARRRRRVLRVLLLLAIVLGLAAVLGAVPPWAPGVPVLLLISYLVELRVQVRRARSPQVRVTVAPAAVEPPRRARVALLRSRADRDDAWDPWPSFDLNAPPATELPGRLMDLEAGWQPRAVPLPTYVTAPKAPANAAGRRIDVSAGRPWTLSADDNDTEEIPLPAAEPTEPAPAPAPAAPPTAIERDVQTELDVDVEHKRAVGD